MRLARRFRLMSESLDNLHNTHPVSQRIQKEGYGNTCPVLLEVYRRGALCLKQSIFGRSWSYVLPALPQESKELCWIQSVPPAIAGGLNHWISKPIRISHADIYPPAIAGGTDCIQHRFLTFEARLHSAENYRAAEQVTKTHINRQSTSAAATGLR